MMGAPVVKRQTAPESGTGELMDGAVSVLPSPGSVSRRARYFWPAGWSCRKSTTAFEKAHLLPFRAFKQHLDKP
jgi:hypothetical protein